MHFVRSKVAVKPDPRLSEFAILNPACTRLRDGTLAVYPRVVAPGNVSRVGFFRGAELEDGTVELTFDRFALEPEAPYEFRSEPGGYGCEDPRVTFVPVLDRYLMAYVAFGPRGAEVAVAHSGDGLQWQRLGPVQFRESGEPFGDKDAAFFPEPVPSPEGVESLALYHRPTMQRFAADPHVAIEQIKALAPEEREGIAIGYVPLEAVRRDFTSLCNVEETHRIPLPPADWGTLKVGAGAPPVRIAAGWLSVIHGVDAIDHPVDGSLLRYCAGVIIQDAQQLERILYRSPQPLFVPEVGAELHGAVGHVVFPTGLDRRAEREYDLYYGMADDAIGRGRLTLDQ